MICPRCGSAMRLAMTGGYQCPECWDPAEPVWPGPAVPVEGTALALQRLQRRIGRLEVALADLRRRLGTDQESGILPAGAAHAAAYRLDDTRASFGSLICPPAADQQRFLGSDPENEEPRRGEPGETR